VQVEIFRVSTALPLLKKETIHEALQSLNKDLLQFFLILSIERYLSNPPGLEGKHTNFVRPLLKSFLPSGSKDPNFGRRLLQIFFSEFLEKEKYSFSYGRNFRRQPT